MVVSALLPFKPIGLWPSSSQLFDAQLRQLTARPLGRNRPSLVVAARLSCRLTALMCPSYCLLLHQANQLDSKLPLPKLGLAQVEVLRGQPINAVSILESVLLDVPQWIDALQASTCAHACRGQAGRASRVSRDFSGRRTALEFQHQHSYSLQTHSP